MKEGTLVKWAKNPGDSLEPGEILAEVETDKAVMEMESFDEGILLERLVSEGDKLPLGAPLAILGAKGEDVSELTRQAKQKLAELLQSQSSSSPASESAPAPAKPVEPSPGEAAAMASAVAAASAAPVVPASASASATPAALGSSVLSSSAPFASSGLGSSGAGFRHEGRIFASPLARRIAGELGVDLNRVQGTGPDGRISKADVYSFLNGSARSGSASTGGAGAADYRAVRADEKISVSGIRGVIAERLLASKQNVPHYYLKMEVRVDALLALRREINAELQNDESRAGDKITVNDMLTKAAALALVRHPACNSSWRGDHILSHGRVDIGIAVAMEGGLITPYIRGADELGLLDISRSARSLIERARERKLKPEEFTDGTFTISNLGMFGLREFSAIINAPEAAILAVGGVEEKLVLRDGAPVATRNMILTLSCDHRVVDGADGAAFLATLKNLLENPHMILL